MNRSADEAPYFHAIAAFIFRPNRLYRVYVRSDELVFIYIGSGGEFASAMGLICPVSDEGPEVQSLERFTDTVPHDSAIARRLEVLDRTPLSDLIDDHKHNFRAPFPELSHVRLEPMSIAHAEGYSDPNHVGLLKFRHQSRGRFTLGVQGLADMRTALTLLSPLLGEKLAVDVVWDDQSQQLVSKTPLEEFGNGFRQLVRITLVGGLLIGMPVLCLFVITAWAHGRLDSVSAFFKVLMVPAFVWVVLPLAVLPTCLTSIRVRNGQVIHLLLRCVVLSRHSIDRLISIEVARKSNKPFGLVLRFSNGRALRTIGMHLRVTQFLCAHLQSVAGRPIKVLWGG